MQAGLELNLIILVEKILFVKGYFQVRKMFTGSSATTPVTHSSKIWALRGQVDASCQGLSVHWDVVKDDGPCATLRQGVGGGPIAS